MPDTSRRGQPSVYRQEDVPPRPMKPEGGPIRHPDNVRTPKPGRRPLDYSKDDAQAAMRAVLRASLRVREGRWLRGAPSHVLAELLTELSKDGWHLRHDGEAR